MGKRRSNLINESSGTVAVVAALGLAISFGFAALALDIGHLLSVKNELKRAADAGALAGARALWPTILGGSISTPPNCATAQSVALSVSTNSLNKVDGAGLAGSKVTVETGKWDYLPKTFNPGSLVNTNGVRVVTQATVANMFFAGIIGKGPYNLSATSVAIMDFANSLKKIPLPVAINQPGVIVGQILKIDFTTSNNNGGWFTVPPASANASTYVDYISNGTIPRLNVGDIINLQNGQDASVLQLIQDKLASYNGTWDTFLPVVNTSAFTGSQAITGFVPFRVTAARSAGSDKGVTGTVLGLEESDSAQPGGINFGLLAPPKLML